MPFLATITILYYVQIAKMFPRQMASGKNSQVTRGVFDGPLEIEFNARTDSMILASVI